jgi:ATP-dependent protease ClpP protease subunit
LERHLSSPLAFSPLILHAKTVEVANVGHADIRDDAYADSLGIQEKPIKLLLPTHLKQMKTHPTRKRCKVLDEDESECESSDILQIKDSVYFYAEVTPQNILKLLVALDKATRHALESYHDINECRVYLYVNSFGGDAYSGLSAMDHIRLNRVSVITVADGFVASAATLILLGGHERKMLKNAKVLIHQLSTQFLGKFKDLLDEVDNSKELMANFKEIYGKETYMKNKEIDDLIHKELHMNARQALKYGFVDDIW